MSNFFEQAGERQINGAQRAKERRQVRKEERAEAKAILKAMKPSPLQQKMLDQAELLKLYRAWRRALKTEIVTRHMTDFRALMRLIHNLHWNNVEDAVAHVERARWLRRADDNTKLATLNYIDASIMRSRIRYGLSPIDDGIPLIGEPPSPGIRCRMILFGY